MDISSKIVQEAANAMQIQAGELQAFLDLGSAKEYEGAAYLFNESSPRTFLGILLEGTVDLVRGVSGSSVTVASLGEGAIMNESILLDDLAHSVSGVARSAVKVWEIPKEKIEEYREENPAIYYRMVGQAARRISNRLREATVKMSSGGQGTKDEIVGYRREHDSLGEREISNAFYFGVQTSRALENFQFSGIPLSNFDHLVNALAYVKKAAATANKELGVVDAKIADAICAACDEILGGKLHDQFVVDMIQGGAGTSTNMNANEVIANRALEILGHQKGEYEVVHPNDHVNYSQSTNDAYPTSIKLAVVFALKETTTALGELQRSLEQKAEEFSDVIKMGRTENQDAIPMTLGQEFAAYAVMVEDGIRRLTKTGEELLVINMGATAIGTGLNSPKGYAELCTQKLKEFTGLNVSLAKNLVEATQDAGEFALMSSNLKVAALQISKICNDLRWASSGPRCGLGEIRLPALQPGSSIMPGKVNPVAPEVVNQICYQIFGGDTTVSMAAEASEFELNMAEPIICYNLLMNTMLLKNAAIVLANRCVKGIEANREHCEQKVRNSIGIVTALNPHLGYEKSASVAKEALKTGGSVYDLTLEKGWLTKEELDEILSPERMANPLGTSD